jgi:spore coat polysaccharide biosynthesis predicted glycosyltransferase SpsG
MKKMFPKHKENIIISTGKTALEIASELHDKEYTNLVMVVGSDRVKEYQSYFEKSKRDIHVIELKRDESSISAPFGNLI